MPKDKATTTPPLLPKPKRLSSKGRVAAVPPSRLVRIRTTHPLYGSDTDHDNFMSLCELTVDIAIDEARRRLEPQFDQLVDDISDEMLATATEYEP